MAEAILGFGLTFTQWFLSTPVGQFLVDSYKSGTVADLKQREREGTLTDEEKKQLQKIRQAESQLSQVKSLESQRLLEFDAQLTPYTQLLAIVWLAKNRPDILKTLGNKWLDTQARVMVALAQAGAGNLVNAWANSHLIAMMLEHNYMIRKGGAGGLIARMNWLTGALALAEIIGGISVPSTLVYSAVAGKEEIVSTLAKAMK